MKACKKCGVEKPDEDFYIKHSYECKECTRKRMSLYGKTERGKEVDRKRNKKAARKKKQVEYSKKSKAKHRKAYKATRKFWNVFRYGSIKKSPCAVCGTEELVEAHHHDYDKPLDVIWLCSLHHKEWHRKNDAKNPF